MRWKQDWPLISLFAIFIIMMVLVMIVWAIETCPKEICG